MIIPSWVWVIAVFVAAGVVAIGSIQYQRSRDAEKQQEMALQARSLVQPEIQRNHSLLSRMREGLKNRQFYFKTFDTTAWQTVSSSGLLLGLSNDEFPRLMKAYYLMNQATGMHSQLVELSIGMGSALDTAKQTKDVLLQNLIALLDELEPVLRALDQTNQEGDEK